LQKNSKTKIRTVLASLDLGLADDELDFLGNILFEDSPDFIDSGDDVFNTLLIYRTQEDSKVDDIICLPLQNQEFEFDDPLRPVIPDDTHPNCRCYWENANSGQNLGQDGAFATASISNVTSVFADTVDGKEGHWKTIKGTPVFFPDGEDAGDVISKAFKNRPAPKSKAPTKQAPKSKKEPLRFSEAREKHQEFLKKNKGESYSFDPKTGKGYNAFDQKEGIEMYNRYDKSDGKDPVYFISETNHQGQLTRESESAYVSVTNKGKDAVIGRWISDDTGFDYTDISSAESGLGKKGSDREIRTRLKEAGQESALKLFSDGTVDFVNAR